MSRPADSLISVMDYQSDEIIDVAGTIQRPASLILPCVNSSFLTRFRSYKDFLGWIEIELNRGCTVTIVSIKPFKEKPGKA